MENQKTPVEKIPPKTEGTKKEPPKKTRTKKAAAANPKVISLEKKLNEQSVKITLLEKKLAMLPELQKRLHEALNTLDQLMVKSKPSAFRAVRFTRLGQLAGIPGSKGEEGITEAIAYADAKGAKHPQDQIVVLPVYDYTRDQE